MLWVLARGKKAEFSQDELPRPLKMNSPMPEIRLPLKSASSDVTFGQFPAPRAVGVFFPLRQVGLNSLGLLNSLLVATAGALAG